VYIIIRVASYMFRLHIVATMGAWNMQEAMLVIM
jgi:hypothetical protein